MNHQNDPDGTRQCPRCYAPLRASESPEGLCPKCLLAVGMGEDAVIRTGTGAPVPAPPGVDDLAPHFEGLDVLSLIGRGGGGAVYRAIQRDLGRQVALKILLLDPNIDPTFGERFVREARAMATLSHPNIAAVHDAGRAGPYWYLVMELVDGPNLRQVIQSRDMTPTDSLDVVRQICTALEYAHGEGVVHRDIKPENVLVDRRGRVKLVDFGLAKLLGHDAAGSATLTRSAQAMGTWHYMAPEQLRRPLEVDHRADIYSLGVVLYELLTGEIPQGRYAPASERARTDRRLDAIVDRALAQDPTQRYQEASGVREDVARVQSGPASFENETPEEEQQEPPRRKAKLPKRNRDDGHAKPAAGCMGGGCVTALIVAIVGFFALIAFSWMFLGVSYSEHDQNVPSISMSSPDRRPSTLRVSPPRDPAFGDPAPAALKPTIARASATTSKVRDLNQEVYDSLLRRHSILRAFATEKRRWLQLEITPFEQGRDAVDVRGRVQGKILQETSAFASVMASERFPYGKQLDILEVTLLADDTVDVHRNGELLAASLAIASTDDLLLRPAIDAAGSAKNLKRILRSASGLPWTIEQIGLTYAPSRVLEQLAMWWRHHERMCRQRERIEVGPQQGVLTLTVDGMFDAHQNQHAALAQTLVATYGLEAWHRWEQQINWQALAPAGLAQTTRLSVGQERESKLRYKRTGTSDVVFAHDEVPWYLEGMRDRLMNFSMTDRAPAEPTSDGR